MSHIHLRHPVHGTKIATMEQEAIYDETNGWMRYDPDTPSSDAADVDAPVNELAPLRRRGRRPAE